MTHAKKVDNNQKEIYAALRQVYATVIDLSGVGKGIPDSLIIYRNQLYLIEIKNGKNGLTKAQKEFFMKVYGCDKIGVVKTPEEALRFIGAINGSKV